MAYNRSKAIPAIFKGQDGSRGFRTGQRYFIEIKVINNQVWVFSGQRAPSCPYETFGALLNNWTLEEPDTFQPDLEEESWDDF